MSDSATDEVDITQVSKALAKITFTSYTSFFIALNLAITSILTMLADAVRSSRWTILDAFLLAISAVAVRNLWVSTGVFSTHAMRRLRFTFLVTLAVSIVFSVGFLWVGMLPMYQVRELGIEMGTQAFLVTFLTLCVLIGAALYGLLGMRDLRRSTVFGSKASFLSVLDVVEKNAIRPSHAKRIRSVHARGLLLGLFGALLMMVGILFGSLLTTIASYGLGSIVGNALVVPGALLIMRSRRYFVADASAVLAADKRAPVLYLRSFQDDDISIKTDQNILLDYSLETRLAKYFAKFGPFLAVGAPSEPLPQLGAARLSLAEDFWQRRVVDLMGEAKVIVALLGKSTWIGWEIRQILDAELHYKTIFLLPEIKTARMVDQRKLTIEEAARQQWRPGSPNIKLYQERVGELNRALDGTWLSEVTKTTKDPEFLRAIVMVAGHCTRITSRNFGRGSFHFAAILAHYLLIEHPV